MHKSKPVHNAQNLQNVWQDCTKKCRKPNLSTMRRTCKMCEKIASKNAENQACPQCAESAKCLKRLHQKMQKSKHVHNAQNLQNVWKDCTKKCRKPNLSTMRRTCKMFEKIASKNAENQTCPQCAEPAKCVKRLHQKMFLQVRRRVTKKTTLIQENMSKNNKMNVRFVISTLDLPWIQLFRSGEEVSKNYPDSGQNAKKILKTDARFVISSLDLP